jgi:Terminase large subunit, T4likevirus-type, N-terminal/Terminase RNaseH-like domain
MFTPAQEAFVYSKAPFPAFCGGFGSGKTAAGIARIMRLKRLCPNQDVAYYLPTYGLVEDIAYKRFPAMFERLGLNFKLNQQKAVMQTDIGDIIFRTMDNPARIVGYEVAHSLIDELDTLPTEKARDVWNKVIARNRQKAFTASGQSVANTVAVATTPEGFRFVYERWQKNKTDGYVLFKAKTSDNANNLPANYIQTLVDTYPENLRLAYLDGEFVNLTSGSVYQEFDRKLNYCDSVVQEREPLHVGMDFNVGKMAAVVWVLRETNPHAVNEFTDVFDTPAMCALIKRTYPNHAIYIYPDASGNARKSQNASESDLTILRQAGFTVLVNSRNPAVKDRILATNAMMHNQGIRKLFVNTDTCPALTESFEKQAYDKNGEPDKSSGLDHVIDAATYFIAYKFPILTQTKRITIHGL